MNLHPSFISPQYNGHCFADLPATIRYWLTGKGKPGFAPDVIGDFNKQYDVVFSFFIDSLGWELFNKYLDDNSFFRHLISKGRVTKITSQFPSTTAAHVTCIHTGLPVGKSGIYEWQYYEPKIDAVMSPLLFSYAGTMKQDTLKSSGVDPKILYPNETFYDTLNADGVSAFSFGSRSFTPSTYSEVVMRGAKLRPFITLPEGLVDVASHAAQAKTPTYLFYYYGDIDTMCHMHGPDSVQTRAQIEDLNHVMERWFMPLIKNLGKRALFVMYADHGHMGVTPQNTVYLNTQQPYRDIVPMLRTDAQGNVLVPAGSPRDPFLYVREERLDDAYTLLSNALEGYADVVKTSDLLEAGYFGPLPVSPDLLGRLGNLTVLPHPGNCVWWYEKDKFEQKHFGHHGGLTASEMETPLALLEI